MGTAWMVLSPVDTLVFRDGRPFDAGADTLARVTMPRPPTTAGCAKHVFGREPVRVCGPLLVRRRVDDTFTALLPWPADLLEDGRAVPHRFDGWDTDLDSGAADGRFELAAGVGDPAGRLLEVDDIETYLDGGVPTGVGGGLPGTAPVGRERRVGLRRGSDGVAQEGYLYAADHLRLAEDQAFACRVAFDGDVPTPTVGTVRLGGEAGLATVEVVADDDVRLPAARSRWDATVVVYLITPAVFPGGWRLPPVDGAELVSGCVDGPMPVSSWGPSGPPSWQLRWTVAAGSVYFLRFADGAAAGGFAARMHGCCLPQATDRLRTAGFGMCLVGRCPVAQGGP